MIEVDKIGVHATHCCKRCGCKYYDDDCPVVLGIVEAEYECEDCESRLNSLVDDLNYASAEDLYEAISRLTPMTKSIIKDAL
ncbi:hypothetical protein SCRM01_150c [Synechococcus phage S-CRM01]|uniref:hypothetical protein n=1 Tax=Synechococcus phage S-CRM01 TaxID=1026955 RepID=UPI000209E3E7|nr:hypothetical protein SCRM01_150c [Synechococcus phage S-CRM01]AEC53096.1 hypothetical protein SCRM01_150c [Synechococcus phage S-CRM01]